MIPTLFDSAATFVPELHLIYRPQSVNGENVIETLIMNSRWNGKQLEFPSFCREIRHLPAIRLGKTYISECTLEMRCLKSYAETYESEYSGKKAQVLFKETAKLLKGKQFY